jgi:D-alanyl-D-alanine carboxypeptidase (penicillin-binding protein 5/6)
MTRIFHMIKPSPAPKPRYKVYGRKYVADAPANVAKRILYFAAAGTFSGLFFFAVNIGQVRFEDFLYAQISEPLDSIVYATPAARTKSELELDAKAAISLRIGATGRERMIYQKNTDGVLPIASLTKLMTATVVLETPEIYNLDKQVAISYAAANQNDVPVFGNLKPGEVYSVRQLLNLMLYYSSNDAAAALAEMIGEDRFVSSMNSKAAGIGLAKTTFYNPHGLDIADGKANLSSANDLLALVKYILKNHPEIFAFSIQPGPYLTENGIFSLNLWDGQTLTGGKTGYTELAGGCMISVFENAKHRQYINILLGAVSSESRVIEMQKLINYANNSAL